MFCLRAKARFTQLADAETCGRMVDTGIDVDDVEGDWRPSAHNAANNGIAITKQHPVFCYSMAWFDNPTSLNGARLNPGMHTVASLSSATTIRYSADYERTKVGLDWCIRSCHGGGTKLRCRAVNAKSFVEKTSLTLQIPLPNRYQPNI